MNRLFYLFTLPWVAGFAGFTAFPLGYAFWLSLTNTDALAPESRFVGAANYAEVLDDGLAGEALVRTLVFTAVTVPASVAGGLLFAVLLQLPVRGRSLYRAVLFLPAVVPPVAGALTFGALFDRDTGAVNVLLERFGVAGPGWTDGPRLPFVIGVLVLWGLGNLMMVSLAALADVPRDLFDAARVDGAGPLRTFTSVTLPLVSPVLLFQVVTGVIAGLQTYLPALVLGSAGAGGSLAALPEGGYFFMAHVYTRYAVAGRFGYASALLWALFVVTLLCAALMLRTTRRHVFTLTSPGGARP